MHINSMYSKHSLDVHDVIRSTCFQLDVFLCKILNLGSETGGSQNILTYIKNKSTKIALLLTRIKLKKSLITDNQIKHTCVSKRDTAPHHSCHRQHKVILSGSLSCDTAP